MLVIRAERQRRDRASGMALCYGSDFYRQERGELDGASTHPFV